MCEHVQKRRGDTLYVGSERLKKKKNLMCDIVLETTDIENCYGLATDRDD